MLRRRLTAQQDGAAGEQGPIQPLLDLPLGHEGQEPLLVLFPGALGFLVGVQQCLSRGEKRFVDVLGPADFSQEKREVVPFREPRQLRDVVQPDIDQSSDSVLLEKSEEFCGGFLRKTDRIDFHGFSPYRS
jgi:hypothetical protein